MPNFHLKPVSFGKRYLWYSTSLIYGICVFATGFMAGAFENRDSLPFALCLFAACWIIGAFLLRLYVRQVTNPTDFWAIVGAGRKMNEP